MKSLFVAIFLVLGLHYTTIGCGSDDPSEPQLAEPGEFKLATFNAGLAPGDVEYSSQRAPLLADALAEQDVDLLCVQEFWQEQDWDELVSNAKSHLPNIERLNAIEDCRAPICAPLEFETLQECVQNMCPDRVGDGLATCALSGCSDQVAVLETGCVNCLIAQIEQGKGIEAIAESCLGSDASDTGESYLYDCGYDTGILTHAEILEQASMALDSFLVASAVNYARVDTEVGELHVFCAHLASAISTFEYAGDFDSWKDEQRHQIDQLIDIIDEKRIDSVPVVLLGDLNSGPSIPISGIQSRWEDHYRRFLDQDFENPYAEQSDVACTSCPDNTFHTYQSDPTLIDHILLKGFSGSALGERFFTEVQELELSDQRIESHPSDHYGLMLTLQK